MPEQAPWFKVGDLVMVWESSNHRRSVRRITRVTRTGRFRVFGFDGLWPPPTTSGSGARTAHIRNKGLATEATEEQAAAFLLSEWRDRMHNRVKTAVDKGWHERLSDNTLRLIADEIGLYND